MWHLPKLIAWPPPHLRVPDDIVSFRRSKDLERQQCYVCTGYGHSGNKCPYLTAVYICTDIGQALLRRANVTVPPGIMEASQPFVLTLRQVLSYRWPLRLACVIAKAMLEDDTLDEELESFGDYEDKKRMAEELGNPRDWEWMPWDKLYKRLITQRASSGLPPPTPRRDTRKDIVPDIIITQRHTDIYRNPQASRMASSSGASSTQDNDFTDIPMQDTQLDTQAQSSTTQSETQQEPPSTQQATQEEAQPSTQQETQVEEQPQQQEMQVEAQPPQPGTQLATQVESTIAYSANVPAETPVRHQWNYLD